MVSLSQENIALSSLYTCSDKCTLLFVAPSWNVANLFLCLKSIMDILGHPVHPWPMLTHLSEIQCNTSVFFFSLHLSPSIILSTNVQQIFWSMSQWPELLLLGEMKLAVPPVHAYVRACALTINGIYASRISLYTYHTYVCFYYILCTIKICYAQCTTSFPPRTIISAARSLHNDNAGRKKLFCRRIYPTVFSW